MRHALRDTLRFCLSSQDLLPFIADGNPLGSEIITRPIPKQTILGSRNSGAQGPLGKKLFQGICMVSALALMIWLSHMDCVESIEVSQASDR